MKVAKIGSPLESRIFEIDGVSLHVVLAGPANGKPLIFLHGFPEFWFAWRDQIDYFVSSGYRVIIPDQRGYNLSDKPAGILNYSINLLAGDIVGLLDKVATSKAFIVGHDVGAAVTWYLVAQYPDRFMRAAILSAPHFRVLLEQLITNPAQLRKSWYIFFFQLLLAARKLSCVGTAVNACFGCSGILCFVRSSLIPTLSHIRSRGRRRVR